MRKSFSLLIITLAVAFYSPSNSEAASSLQDLFWRRAWPEMELQFKSIKKKSTRDYSLMANAYRFQEKWAEAVSILEAQSKNFPASVRPYADMTLLLGYENLHQTQRALTLAESLYKSAPADLKYYVALAQYRINDSQGSPSASLTALNRMLQNAGTDERKIYTLTRLVQHPADREVNSHALQLLELQAGSKEAASVLARVKNPNNNIRVALGLHYHTVGENRAALDILTGATGRKAQYYRAWANSRLKNNNDALNLWGALAVSGNSYASSSVTRIANLAKDNGMRDACMRVLDRIARERRGNVQARALQSLVNLTGKSNTARRDALEAQILKSFPGTTFAFNTLWARAWRNLDAGNYAEAVKLFRQCDAPGVNQYRRARILYWLGHAQAMAGQNQQAANTLALLKRKYPLTIYAFLTGQKLNIVNGTNPNLALKETELEQWGFVYHAYLRLSRPKASTRELYRALHLSRWLGLEESYSEARRLETLMTSSTTMYRQDLEALYPRPYKASVDAACRQYGTETNFVWAIMRQESAFNVNARSWVGAAGLMQFMPATAREEAKRAGIAHYDLYNANDSIRLGASHLATLKKSLGREEYVMAAYNAGSGNARKWLKNGGANVDLARWIEAVKISETNGYVQRVSANLEVYRLLYDGR
ncbi:MAG: lytic transglycosylase domain-containing protein [Synergistaceae bacterium]|nr:lytic transglycosylase domain-containing protein [Synergistaceae bacterium]